MFCSTSFCSVAPPSVCYHLSLSFSSGAELGRFQHEYRSTSLVMGYAQTHRHIPIFLLSLFVLLSLLSSHPVCNWRDPLTFHLLKHATKIWSKTCYENLEANGSPARKKAGMFSPRLGAHWASELKCYFYMAPLVNGDYRCGSRMLGQRGSMS